VGKSAKICISSTRPFLGNGKSFTRILEVYSALDQHYYNAYNQELALTIDPDKKVDIVGVIKSKARKFLIISFKGTSEDK